MRRIFLIMAFFFSTASYGQAQVQSESSHYWDISGSIGVELRSFLEDPQFISQFDHFQPSLIIEPDLNCNCPNYRHRFKFIPFIRVDAQDKERTHVDLREAYWRYLGDELEVLAGVNRVFFGVAESRHLVNIINQIDYLEDVDEENFLGQPMINIGYQKDWGRLDFYLMSGFRERNFPDRNSRLRTAIPVDEKAVEFESSLNQGQPDFLIRYFHFVGDLDAGIYYFEGTSREPILFPAPDGNRLIPLYNTIKQVGLDLQLTRGATLYKFEGIMRSGQGNPFGAMVAGFEHTVFQFYGSATDLGLLAEYLLDKRGDEAPKVFTENDLFLGTRLQLNDIQDTTAIIGTIIDLNNGSTAIRVETERRVGDRWKIELESQLFLNVSDEDTLTSFKDDSFITLRFSLFF